MYVWFDPQAVLKDVNDVAPFILTNDDWRLYEDEKTTFEVATTQLDSLTHYENGAVVGAEPRYDENGRYEIISRISKFTNNGAGLDYYDWLAITNGLANSLGVDEALEICHEFFPEQTKGEYNAKMKSRTAHHSFGSVIGVARNLGVDISDVQPNPELIKKANEAQARIKSQTDETFPLIHADEIRFDPVSRYLIKSLLALNTFNCIYGASNSGKTFVSLDMACCIVSGKPWRGMKVKKGAVIYLCLEGDEGIKNRVIAAQMRNKFPRGSNLLLCPVPISLLEDSDTTRLINTINKVAKECDEDVVMVVVDTLSRAMAGGDENSPVDMTKLVSSCDVIREQGSISVLLVHHTGKDAAKGLRGHSSLIAALDTALEVKAATTKAPSSVNAFKQRDRSKESDLTFKLDVVELGTDDEGDVVTSCVVQHDLQGDEDSKNVGRKKKYEASELLELLPQNSKAEWFRTAEEKLKISEPTVRRRFNELKQDVDYSCTNGRYCRISPELDALPPLD